MKKIFIIIGVLLIIYIAFVTIDCIRLKNANRGIPPLITVNNEEYDKDYEYGKIFTGIGYTVRYYNSKNTAGYGTEIKLFGIIPVCSIEAQ